jgi:hyperosmotically inducible protein
MNMHLGKPVVSSAIAVLMTFALASCNKPQQTPVTSTTSAAATASTTVGSEIADADVTTKVKTALLTDAEVKSFDISIVTTKGDVRVGGVVDNQKQIDSALKVVRGVDGVHSVHDELTIKK